MTPAEANMDRRWRFVAFSILCAMLVGCETGAVPVSYYDIPPDSPDTPNPKIGGLKKYVLLGDDTRTFAGAIDGKMVKRENDADYDRPIPLTPGIHAVS